MKVREAVAADIPQLMELERQSHSAAHWGENQYNALFSDGAPARTVLVAAEDAAEDAGEGRVRGFAVALCLLEEWEIENLVVDPAFRRRGVGSQLVHELLSQAVGQNATTVLLEVRESNLAATRLYEQLGFTVQGRRAGYYRNPTEDAVLLGFKV